MKIFSLIEPPKNGASGFTLLELLVTLSIIAIASTISLVAFKAAFRTVKIDYTMNQVLSDIKHARITAARKNKVITFIFEKRKYRIQPLGISRSIQSELTVTSKGMNLSFYPDGYTSGGQIMITDGKRNKVIIVQALTGNAYVLSSKTP